MQQGIGRTGYLLLALGALTFGLFGLVLAWTAYSAATQLFFEMGVGVAAIGLLTLFLFAATSHRETVEPRTKPVAPVPSKPVEPARSEPAEDAFEFNDYTPAPKAAPEDLVLPPAFVEEKPPMPHAAPQVASRTGAVQFQEAKAPGDWPQRRKGARPALAPEPPEPTHRRELTHRYTETTPMVRQILEGPAHVTERLADRAPRDMNTDFVAPGMSVGRCGQCKTLLLAPEERPLRLKCPECAKVTLLE